MVSKATHARAFAQAKIDAALDDISDISRQIEGVAAEAAAARHRRIANDLQRLACRLDRALRDLRRTLGVRS